MQKFTKKLVSVGFTILTLITPLSVFAESTKEVEELIEKETPVLIEINTEDENQASIVKDFLTNSLSFLVSADSPLDVEKTYNELIEELTTNNKILIAYENDSISIISKLSEKFKDELTPLFFEKSGSYSEKHNNIEFSCANETSKTCVTYLNPYMVITVGLFESAKPGITKIIDLYGNNSDPESILLNSDYLKIKENFLSPRFLSIFTSIKNLTNSDFKDILSQQAVLDTKGFSFNKEDDHYTFKMTGLADESKMAENGIDYQKYQTIPFLYKKFPALNPIFYLELNNISENILGSVNKIKEDETQLKEYDNFKNEFKSFTNLEFEEDFLELFKKQSALSVNTNDSIFPNVTLMIDVNDKKEKAEEIVKKLEEKIFTWLSTMPEESYFPSETYIYTNTLTEITFYPAKIFENSLKEEEKKLLENEKIVITYGITDDNILIFSSNPDISNSYGKDEGLKEALSGSFSKEQIEEKLNFMAFLNVENIKNFLIKDIDTFSENLSDEKKLSEEKINEYKENINTGLGFLNKITILSNSPAPNLFNIESGIFFSDPNTSISNLYNNSLNENQNHYIQKFKTREKVLNKFKDVLPSDWFFTYLVELNELNALDHLQTPEEQDFNYAKPITRIEFLTTIIRTFGIEIKETDPSNTKPPLFTDVKTDDWFYPIIETAVEDGIITGYEDNTFKPDQEINRAEALKIITKLSPKLSGFILTGESTIPFEDVGKDQWFYEVVAKCYLKQIVNGISEKAFEPGRPIFRSEAMKIVYNIYAYEKGLMYGFEDYYPNFLIMF